MRVEVSAEDIAGENDWFGLAFMVFVEDQRVPFRDLFLALSRGEPYLLLRGGAYFSLDKPGLQALARLIEEARALQDGPADGPADQQVPGGPVGGVRRARPGRPQASGWQRQVDGLLSFAGAGVRTA